MGSILIKDSANWHREKNYDVEGNLDGVVYLDTPTLGNFDEISSMINEIIQMGIHNEGGCYILEEKKSEGCVGCNFEEGEFILSLMQGGVSGLSSVVVIQIIDWVKSRFRLEDRGYTYGKPIGFDESVKKSLELIKELYKIKGGLELVESKQDGQEFDLVIKSKKGKDGFQVKTDLGGYILKIRRLKNTFS